MGFPRQEYWSGLPCPPPGDLPIPGIESRSPALQVDSLLSEPPGNPKNTAVGCHSLLQGIFPSQGLKPGLLHHRQILYRNLKDPLPLLASENNFNSPKGIPAPVHKLMQSYPALSCLLRKGVATNIRCCSFFPLALTFFQFSSVTQSYLTLCDPMNRAACQASLSITNSRSPPKPESTQTHVHQPDDAIQPSHLLSSPSSPSLNCSQH